jgi:mannosyl-3-phosphoglycerate phosphatase family protein
MTTGKARSATRWHRSRRSLLVATDLDGTLLDERTYDFSPAIPALALLEEQGALLVPVSSKSRPEMERIVVDLGVAGPFIAENGSLLVIPRAGGGYEPRALGVPRPVLVAALAEIARETGAELRGFSSLSPGEVSELTGLSSSAAMAALDREQDEPFLISDPATLSRVSRAARRRGLRVTKGGRFPHLVGPVDKGLALRALLGELGRPIGGWITVGLGDAGNDLPLLRAVDRPIVVPGPDGAVRAELRALPDAERAPAPGPAGWNAAILAVLSGERLPLVGEAEPA